MLLEIEIDENLFYLNKILISLEKYFFDDEVKEHLKKLSNLVNRKLYSSLTSNKDIIATKFKIIFKFE